MLRRSNLSNYGDAYILVKGTITVEIRAAAGDANNAPNKKVIFKNCASFTNCISRRNNTQVDDAQDMDVAISMYNLIEYSNSESKASGILWQFYRDVLALNDNDAIVDFNVANNTTRSFNLKVKLTSKTEDDDTKDVEIMLSLKYLSNFWRTLQIPLIN